MVPVIFIDILLVKLALDAACGIKLSQVIISPKFQKFTQLFPIPTNSYDFKLLSNPQIS